MLQYLEAVSGRPVLHPVSIFLAGGITNCPNWQKELAGFLAEKRLPVTVFNPRRSSFDVTDPTATEKQIVWEYEKLHRAELVSFWFCAETLCPIVLYELGAALERGAQVVVGVHAEYERKNDVLLQTQLRRPEVKVHEGWKNFREAVVVALRRLLEEKAPSAGYPTFIFDRSGRAGYCAKAPVTLRQLYSLGLIDGAEELGLSEDQFYESIDEEDWFRLAVGGEVCLKRQDDGRLVTPVTAGVENCFLAINFKSPLFLGGKPVWKLVKYQKEAPDWVLEQAEAWAEASVGEEIEQIIARSNAEAKAMMDRLTINPEYMNKRVTI